MKRASFAAGRLADGAPRPEICFLTTFSGSRPFGRIGAALSRGFRELGVRADVVYVRGEGASESDGVIRAINLGFPHTRSAAPWIARYLNTARPRATVACPPTVGILTLIAGRLTNRVVIPWEVTLLRRDVETSPLWLAPRLKLLGQRRTYRWAPAVAVVSHDVGQNVVETCRGVGEERIHHLPNPLDLDVLERAASEPSPIDSHRFTLCASARLAVQKGIDVLFEALHQIRDDLPSDWVLLLLGEGWMRSTLEALAGRLGLTDRVRFLGRVENPYPVMREADMFVHPARWEGFGLVVLEALALGVPVVATACPGGPREILDGGRYGELVPPDDASSLAEAILRLAREPGERERLTALGPQRARAYSPRTIAERMLEICTNVDPSIGGPSRRAQTGRGELAESGPAP